MFGKRCTLCGGKLDSRKICTECGLDNTKTEKNYRVNQSSCDGMPLTHVHEERDEGYSRRKQKQSVPRIPNRTTVIGQPKKKISRVIKFVFLIWVVICLIITAVDMVSDSDSGVAYMVEKFKNIGNDDYEYDAASYDPYEYLDSELPEEGESAEYVLEPGEYIVGVHIPEGNYEAEVVDDFDTVQVNDKVNGIMLYEYAAKEENYLDDLRLFDGAVVTIDAKNPITFVTENGQVSDMRGMANPLTETYEIRDGRTRTAGKDFEPGVYDMELLSGTGSVEIKVYDEESGNETPYLKGVFFSENERTIYKNLILPKGSEIVFTNEFGEEDDFAEFRLTPSEVIESTNYISNYIY